MYEQQLPGYELQLIAKALRHQGFTQSDLFGDQPLLEKSFGEFPLRLASADEQAIYSHFATLNRDPLLAVDIGNQLDITHYGELGTLLAACPTAHDALENIIRFKPLVAGTLDFELQARPEGPYLRISMPKNLTAKSSMLEAETTMISLTRVMQQITCNEHKWLACFVAGEQKPSKRKALEQALGCPVIDRVSHWGMMMRSSEANAPLPLARPDRVSRLIELCNDLLDSNDHNTTPANHAQAHLRQLSPLTANAKRYADSRNWTERTLHRQLKRFDTSWQQLVDQERKIRTRRALIAGKTIEQCALEIGFSNTKSLHNAVKRWTNQTPGQWRKRLQEKQPMV